ncbi:hypothetical protein DM02DRAFT_548345, partial [Periconia macrospinosa]
VTFGVNDVYDYKSGIENKRKNSRWIDGTALEQQHYRSILIAAKISTAIVILLTFPGWRNSLQLFGCTIAFLALVWAYSSPPFRLKERPIVDSISNGVICWLFWACGYTFSGEKLLFSSKPAVWNGWFILLYGSAMHSLAAIVDVEADSRAQYCTIATILSERYAALFSLICL